jgi:alkylation response protein AidB-like acyl-CoA dehydrogenase
VNLELPEKHRALQAQIREFAATHGHLSPPTGGGRKRPDAQTRAWQALLVERGYAARTVPREYGGFGAEPDILEAALIAEEFAAANLHPGIMNQGISMLVPTLLEVGTEQQRRDWVRATIRGEIIWCQGYSEPGAGSDLAAVSTRAEIDGNDFVVNGQKIWTSSAHYADMMFLLCRTERESSKHAGLSYLLLSMKTPGIEVRPLKTMTGSEFNEVFFTDVRVPMEQIVMGRGDGWKVANITLKFERVAVGNVNKLVHRLQRLAQLLRTTQVDGVPLIRMPEFQTRLLRLQGEEMAWKAHQLRLLTDQAQGKDSGVARMIVKVGGTMTAHRLSALAVDALGAAGTVFEPKGEGGVDDELTGWNTDYLYDIGLLIGGGTSNIQKNIIAERGLGLPREPKVAGVGR